MYLVTASEMQAMDQGTISNIGIPGRVLMEIAGRGAARVLTEAFPHIEGLRVSVMAGRGNNGGDGFVIARCLARNQIPAAVYLLGESSRVKGDAAANLRVLSKLDVPVIELPDPAAFAAHRVELQHTRLWVDAILGTGLQSEVKGYFREVIEFINQSPFPVFAVDMPSGLNADTGQPCGCSVRADVTATFAYPKIGHLMYPGAEFCGRLEVIDIGIPPLIADQVAPRQILISEKLIKSDLPIRPADTHKGKNGHLLVIGGSTGKTGAAAMTSTSAMRAGAGLVTLAVAASLNPILETQLLEAMTACLPETGGGRLAPSSLETIVELMGDKHCLAFGPGIGQYDAVDQILTALLSKAEQPLVIDADGLNLLANDISRLKTCRVPVILTPHPGEMARLAQTTVPRIQQDRVSAARQFAVEHNVYLVLKGAPTVIGHPDGLIEVNPTGNPGMASGGMGDVLTGLIAGLLCQGLTAAQACRLGVFLHGAAADFLAAEKGPLGYLASEVMEAIPTVIGRWSDHR